MKDISKKTVYILLIVYMAAMLIQIFLTMNQPAFITGKASTAQVSVIILSKVPSFPAIPNQTVYVGDVFIYYVNATDADDNNLTFSDNATFFNVTSWNGTTGLINFTATSAMDGVHHVNISVADDSGNSYSQIDVVFTITTAVVPPPAAPPAGGGGGGAVIPGACIPAWLCSSWGDCDKEGMQYRTCNDVKDCRTLEGKPPESRVCLYIPTCFDGMQNGAETDTDCGGQFCRPCEDGRRCKLDRDCVNACDAANEICYTPTEIPPPVVIQPMPVSLWQRFKVLIWSIIKYLMLKWVFTILIMAALILFAVLSSLSDVKRNLRLMYMKEEQSLWRYKRYVLKVFRIKNRKKLRIDLEIDKGKRHVAGIVNLSSFPSKFWYLIRSAAKAYSPWTINMALFEVRCRLKKYYD